MPIIVYNFYMDRLTRDDQNFIDLLNRLVVNG